ncbi:hypothetical protein BC628DRAFT_909015 [Trametes gibbosa]|nr:hypothetical protein BC628DRAFT_909015 [Trametes gibbosa]
MRPLPKIVVTIFAFGFVAPFPGVRGNTEIVNFAASLSLNTPVAQASEWRVLAPTNPQTLLHVLPAPLGASIVDVCEPATFESPWACPHEAWLAVHLNEPPWSSYSMFTLRISWPASYPTNFFIDLYTPNSLGTPVHDTTNIQSRGALDASSTRTKFARIRLVNEGVLTPSRANQNRTIGPIPFFVTVEPLYLGVVPASLVPTLLFLLGLVGVTSLVVLPRISKHMFAVAERVLADSTEAKKRRRNDIPSVTLPTMIHNTYDVHIRACRALSFAVHILS